MTLAFAGVFHISIDGGEQTDAYCIDLLHSIMINDILPQITPDYPCEVVYLLNNAFPTADNIAGALGDVNLEAAAVQAAIWKLTDGFDTTEPATILTRVGQLIAAAQNQCQTVPPVPQSIDVLPASDTNYIDPVHGSGDTTHTVTATLYDTGGQPIPGYPIRIVVTGAVGSRTFDGITDGSGQFVMTYANGSMATGSDTITASVTFTVPVGLEFKTLDKQGIVLAGKQRTGSVKGTATKDWVAMQCGDGLVNVPGETCEPPGAIQPNGQLCRNDCTFCGDGVKDTAETCEPPGAIQPNGQLCRNDCTFCGDGVVQPGEECDDGNDAECDPLRPQKPLNGDRCNNQCAGLICKDPSRIKFTEGLDAFRYHGVMVPLEGQTIDFGSDVAISLTAGQSLVFETSLPAGAIEVLSNGAFKYRNAVARYDGGIYELRARPTRDGTYKVTLFSYGDLSQAAADMVTHIIVSGREWRIHALWRQTASGWVFVGPINPAP